MKKIDEIVETLRRHKQNLKNKYKISDIMIFGSYAEGTQTTKSDIDIIVDFEEPPTFSQFLDIEQELEKLLEVKVDLLTTESISPFIKPYIKETITI